MEKENFSPRSIIQLIPLNSFCFLGCSVCKMKQCLFFQEESVFGYNNAGEQALYVDPVLTEVSEVTPLEHKPTGLLETRDCALTTLSTSSSVVYIPDLNTGYKPQVSNLPLGGSHFISKDERESTTLEDADGHFARLKTYPGFAFSASSMTLLSKTLILDELSLILNQGEFNPLDIQNSRQEETNMILESNTPSETIPEQTLLSDEFVSCLAIGNEDLPSINSYFPQNILESQFNGISLLQKQTLSSKSVKEAAFPLKAKSSLKKSVTTLPRHQE